MTCRLPRSPPSASPRSGCTCPCPYRQMHRSVVGNWLLQCLDDGSCSLAMQGYCTTQPPSLAGGHQHFVVAPRRCIIQTDQAIAFDWTDVDAAANVWLHGLHFYQDSSRASQGTHVAFAPSNNQSSLWLTDVKTEGGSNGLETSARMTLLAGTHRLEHGPCLT